MIVPNFCSWNLHYRNLIAYVRLRKYLLLSRLHRPGKQLISRFKDAGQTLTKDHEKKVLITGIHFTADDGVHKIGNLLLDGSSHFLSAYPCCNGSYSGTGDLFASCITGGLARDISLTEMMQTAGSFLEKSLIDSVEEHVPVNEGVNFEKYLYLLHT